MLEAARIGRWRYDAARRRLSGDALFLDLFDLSAEGPLALDELLVHVADDDAGQLARDLTGPAEGEAGLSRIYRLARGAEPRWVQLHIVAETDGAGVRVGCAGLAQDVTEAQLRRQFADRQAAQLYLALSAARMAPWDTDMTTGDVAPSPRFNELFGFPPDQRLTLDDLRRRYHPEDRERVIRTVQEHIGGPFHYLSGSFRVILPDGTIRWLEARGEIFRDAQGRAVRVLGVAMDITEIMEAEERLELLTRELQHRVKNTLGIVLALVVLSRKSSHTLEDFVDNLIGRIQALARTQDALAGRHSGLASLGRIVEDELRPYQDVPGGNVTILGPDIQLLPRPAQMLSIALHELSTNAAKYGALSTRGGHVVIQWGWSASGDLLLRWREEGGPEVRPPTRQGFGRTVIEHLLPMDLHATVELTFPADGVRCSLLIPRADLTASPPLQRAG